MTHHALKTWRLAQGLNQAQAAEKLGISLRTYQYCEYGQRPVPAPVQKLLDLLQETETA